MRTPSECQRPRQLPAARQQVIAWTGEQLAGDVAGASAEMLSQPRRDLASLTVRDQRVDQGVAAVPAQVGIAPARTARVAGVVDKSEIGTAHPAAAQVNGQFRGNLAGAPPDPESSRVVTRVLSHALLPCIEARPSGQNVPPGSAVPGRCRGSGVPAAARGCPGAAVPPPR